MRFLTVFVVVTALVSPAFAERPPNIILILADDMGWGDLGCYGNKTTRTPHIDQMAAEGMRFTQAYAGSTVCSPSRAVLMTGIHTGHAYQRANDAKDMRPQDVTIAEVLKDAGYSTGLIGKWGLGSKGSSGTPLKQGFDVFYGYLGNIHAHNYYPPFLWRGDEKEKLPNVLGDDAKRKDGSGAAIKKVAYSNDLFADEAIKFLDQHKSKPFFIYLPFTIPHANNEAKPQGMEVPDLGDYAKHADWPDARKGQAAMVTRLDGYVARIMAKLKQLGLDENTLVIFTSDNGPLNEGGYTAEMNDSNGPLRGHKRDLYEGGVREPMIVRWPGHVPSGKTSDQIVWFTDILPTFAELAAADPSKLPKHDGVSVLPTFLGKPEMQKQHEYLYWEFYEQGSKQAVRFGDWKAIRMPMFTGKIELYDLKHDVSEKSNVAAQHPDLVAKAEAMMTAAHTDPEKE